MNTPTATTRARYIMVGGFLGAGKTTALLRFGDYLTRRGLRVGLITNDQGTGLVDTALAEARGFATREIAGGCFCCRFNSLLEAARSLSTAQRPDVFLAEPVGSCTDLVATVSYPLRRIYGDEFAIAPLSVLVDPHRAMRILGLSEGANFSGKVRYIYLKQLEEAEIILINKADLLSPEALERLRLALSEKFPHAAVRSMSARHEEGLTGWFEAVLSTEASQRATMAVDYDTYAEGEELLGWLNATVRLESSPAFDGNDLLRQCAAQFQNECLAARVEVAHLKMTLEPDEALGVLASINLVREDFVPELGMELEDPVTGGDLIINFRAEGSPEALRGCLERALTALQGAFPNLRIGLSHLEAFQPGRPKPTHRFNED